MEPATIIATVTELVTGLAILAIPGLLLSWLWNSTQLDVLSGKTLTAWQATRG